MGSLNWRILTRFSLVILLIAGADVVLARDSVIPPIPFESVGGCPGESCGFPIEMMAAVDTKAMRTHRDGSLVAFPIKKGQRVLAHNGMVVTTTPGTVRVLKACRIGGVTARSGEIIYSLFGLGEGFERAWFRGEILDFSPYEPEGCFKEERGYAAKWLVKVVDAQGRQGWVNPDDGFEYSRGESSGTPDMTSADWLSLKRGQSALGYLFTSDGTVYGVKIHDSATGRVADRILISPSSMGPFVIACVAYPGGESCNSAYWIDRGERYPVAKQYEHTLITRTHILMIINDYSLPPKNALIGVHLETGEVRKLSPLTLGEDEFEQIDLNSLSWLPDKHAIQYVTSVNCYSCDGKFKGTYRIVVDPASLEAREVAKQSPGLLTLPFAVGETWYVCRSYNGPAVHQNRASLDLSIDPRSSGRTGCTPDTASSSKDKVVLSPASGLVLAHFNGEPKDMLCLWLDEKRDVNGDGTPDELFLKIGHLQGMPPVKSRVERGTTRLGTLTAPSTGNGGYSHIHIELVTGDLSTGCTKAAIRVPFSGEVAFQGTPDLPYDGSKNQWQGVSLTQ